MMIQEPLVFEPIAMERVWGGRRLEIMYGKTLPQGVPVGEIWEIVDREEAQSVVHGGPLRGTLLNDLWNRQRKDVFGSAYTSMECRRFPILVKLLDAREKLSVQVHPPAALAAEMGGEPKTEVWYFTRCGPGARIYAGVKKGVTRADFEQGLRDGTVESRLHAIPVHAGDSIFIPSGRLHAIGDGNVIVEIQQNSDTTYRVFDWNRKGLDGKPRALHIDESLACTDFSDIEPSASHVTEGVIAGCPHFHVEKITPDGPFCPAADGRFAIVTVLEGSVECGGKTFTPGAFFLVPACAPDLPVKPTKKVARLLVTTLPA
jgi:mannose-6-phosphate isomerase